MKKELIFMGPPASGKGTQTSRLAQEMNFVHVDTGSLLRESIKNETQYGVIAKSYVSQGKLVPADIVASIIKERLSQSDCSKGFILDGYPRSVEQADALDEMLKDIDNGIDADFKVICFDIDTNILLERIINRQSCPACGAIYNKKFNPSKKADICDICNAQLTQRKDDTAEVAKERFNTYNNETKPLIEYYEKRGKLIKLDANGDKEEIYTRIKKLI